MPYYIPDVVETNAMCFLLPPIQTAFLPIKADPNREIAYVRCATPRTYRTDDHIDLAWDVIRGVC